MTSDSDQVGRFCLVGTAVGLKKLPETAPDPTFWKYPDLISQGFTELHIQCGPDVA